MRICDYQKEILEWSLKCFGKKTIEDKKERNWRFLEESIELVQSLGVSKDDVTKIVDYVFSRDPGDPAQEVGGTMVTLSALCSANNIDLSEASAKELERNWMIIDQIREKHARKPLASPLPGDYPVQSGEKK